MDLYLATYDCQELEANKEDVIAVNYLMAHIGELFTFVQSSYVAIGNQVRDILRQYNNKINLLDDPSKYEKLFRCSIARQSVRRFIEVFEHWCCQSALDAVFDKGAVRHKVSPEDGLDTDDTLWKSTGPSTVVDTKCFGEADFVAQKAHKSVQVT